VARNEDKKRLTLIEKKILSKISALLMSGLGFVTALAWNDAIQTFFREIFGQQKEIWAKFIYAIFLTAIVVIAGIQIDQMSKRIDRTTTDNQKLKRNNEK